MTNLLEQPHTRPRLVAVVGGRRRPMPARASSTTAARRGSAPATAVTRATREANRLDRARAPRVTPAERRMSAA
jgi:hypothetical protein